MKRSKKKINSREELMLEKQRLRDEIRRIEEEGFFSAEDVISSFAKVKEEGIAGAIVSGLKNDAVKEAAISLGLPLLKLAGAKIEAKAVKTIAKDLVGGYAKWKALQLAYKGLMLAVDKYKTRKEKNAKDE